MSRLYHVYHLRDPETSVVRYVGMSRTPRSRLRAHITEASLRQNTAKKAWIVGLLARGLQPVQTIVASYDSRAAACAREALELRAHVSTCYQMLDPQQFAKDPQVRTTRPQGRRP